MQSVDSIETYAYGMSKVLVSEKEEIKCSNIIKQYKQWSIWWTTLQKKTWKNIIQVTATGLKTRTI